MTLGLQRTAGHALAATAVVSILSVSAPVVADPSELPAPFAYNYGEHETPRAEAMGGALRALGSSTTAAFLNPANLGLSRSYHIQALGQFTPEAARQVYGGAIVDSTRRLSGGLGIVGGFIDPDGVDRSYLDVRLPLAFALSDRFHIGLTGRYLMLDQEGLGPLGNSRASGGLRDPEDPPSGRDALVNNLTFDAGMTVGIADGFYLGVSGHGLSYPNDGLLPTLLGGGLGYGSGDFSIEVDGLADFTSYLDISGRVMAGGEYLLADRVPLRLGYRFDLLAGSGASPSHALSAGAGYVDPRFAFEAAVRRTLAGPSATSIVVGLAFFLESFGLPIQEY